MSEIIRDPPRDLDQVLGALRSYAGDQRSIDPGWTSPRSWTEAVDHLIDTGEIAAVRNAAAMLSQAFPESGYLYAMARAAAAPPEAPAFFADAATKEIEVVPHPGSKTMLILFATGDGNFIDTAWSMHRALAPFRVHTVYLRDLSRKLYREGIASLSAGGREGAIRTLERLARMLGAEEILCAGASAGGHAALTYALELRAEAVLTFSAYTTYSHLFDYAKEIAKRRVGREVSQADFDRLDIRKLYAEAPAPPRTLLVYPADNAHDIDHAKNMAGLPNVGLMPIAGSREHLVHRELIAWGGFDDLLAWLIDARPIAAPLGQAGPDSWTRAGANGERQSTMD
jgi:pimeloyl-ACP methyl ester carboxylesterase